MNQERLEVSVDQLFAIIGAKEVELSIARSTIQKQAAEIARLANEAAKSKIPA